MPSSALAERTDTLVGRREPRLGTDPRGPLTPKTSLGFEVVEFARDVLNEPLLPWQEEAAIRALEVNPDGTFRFRTILILVARQSGKTHLLRTIALWRLFVDGASTILSVAQSLDIAREAWRAGCTAVDIIDDLRAERSKVSRVNGDEYLLLTNGARWKIGAANRSAGRGMSVDMLVMDELREQRSWDAWSALSKTTQARRRGQTWCITNAGDDQSVVLNHLRHAALSGSDDSICLLEWSAPDGCALDDTEAWCQANPGLGHTVSEVAIRSALATDPEPVFRTEVLCQHVPALKPKPFTVTEWDALADPDATSTTTPTFAIDLSPMRTAGAIAACTRMDDGTPLLEVVRHVPGPAELVEAVTDLSSRWPGARWVAAAGAAVESIAPALRDVGVVVKMLPPREVSAACGLLQDHVADGTLAHLGDPILSRAIEGAARKDVGDGAWIWTRRKSDVDISALYAVTLALWDLPPVYDLTQSFG